MMAGKKLLKNIFLKLNKAFSHLNFILHTNLSCAKNSARMESFMQLKYKQTLLSILLLIIGSIFLANGIRRGEDVTVEQKSTVVCLECIGIG